LVVDDDEVQVQMFADWLRASGYEVHTASNGEIGLRLVPSVSAIIVDARMPDIDGFEFLRRVRVEHPHIPVALITGDYLIDEAALNDCRRLEATVVFKPVWLDTLESVAAELMERVQPS
jgi:CheY-like chemotaxis protein